MESLRTRQRGRVLSLLGDAPWKVLVLDGAAQRVLSPLLTVNALREAGVTLHVGLGAGCRERVPEAPAVYLVDAFDDSSVAALCGDVRARLYDDVHAAALFVFPRAAVERLAGAEAAAPLPVVRTLRDGCLFFECVAEDAFVLGAPPPAPYRTFYEVFSDGAAPESAVLSAIEQCASGLFCALHVLCGGPSLPLIAGTRGGAAEAVGARLEARLRDAHSDARAPESSRDAPRPLVVLVDRTADLAGALQHSPLYAALLQDVLGLAHGRVSVDGKESFDVDAGEPFWLGNARLPFPAVADAVDAAVRAARDEEERLRAGGDAPAALRAAVGALPALAERKRVVSAHRSLCVAVLDALKARGLADVVHMAQSAHSVDARRLLEVLRSRGDGTPSAADRLRLYCVCLLLAGDAAHVGGDPRPYESALRESGAEMGALAHVRRARTLIGRPGDSMHVPQKEGASSDSALLGRLAGAGGALGSVLGSVRSLLPDIDKLAAAIGRGAPAMPLVRVVDSVFESLSSGRPDPALFWADPRAPRAASRAPPAAPSRTAHGPHVLVFVVGGSAHAEAARVVEYVGGQRRLSAPSGALLPVFGASDFVAPEAFLAAMARLS